jgi:hypothetical protein
MEKNDRRTRHDGGRAEVRLFSTRCGWKEKEGMCSVVAIGLLMELVAVCECLYSSHAEAQGSEKVGASCP